MRWWHINSISKHPMFFFIKQKNKQEKQSNGYSSDPCLFIVLFAKD